MTDRSDMRTRFAQALASIDVDDLLGVLGLGLIAAGVAAIYWPAALIVVGAAFVAVSVLGARRR